jgi:hypothetical protein
MSEPKARTVEVGKTGDGRTVYANTPDPYAEIAELTAQRDELLKACQLEETWQKYLASPIRVIPGEPHPEWLELHDLAVSLGWNYHDIHGFVAEVRRAAIARAVGPGVQDRPQPLPATEGER